MKLTKQKSILLALVVLFSVSVAPTIYTVRAVSKEAVIEDITWEDIGTEAHYTFSNVTYSTDGTGTDVLDVSNAGIASSVDSEPIDANYFSGKLHTAMGFGIYVDNPEMVSSQFQIQAGIGAGISSGPQLYTYETLSGFWEEGLAGSGAGISVTNSTPTELFAYNEKERYGMGDHDFSDNFDDDTTWWNANVSTAANAFNISSEYQELNASLTEAADLDVDEYFNNAGENKESGVWANVGESIGSESFVVGYTNIKVGVINDLRAYLALTEGKDFTDIVITDYNLSTALVSYNMSEHLVSEIGTAVDYWLDSASSSALYLGLFGVPLFQIGEASTTTSLGGSGSADILASIGAKLNDLGKSIKSGAITFGTNLKQFGDRTRDWITGAVSTARKQASDAYHDVGGFIKSALSKGKATLKTAANHIVNVGKSIGTGVRNLGTNALNAVKSFGTGILKALTNPFLLLALVIIIAIVAYVVLKKVEFI